MKIKRAIPLMLLLACNVADDQSLRARDQSLNQNDQSQNDWQIDRPYERPHGPCQVDPESQACRHYALMIPLSGRYGRYTVQHCIDDPASKACGEHVRQLCASESFIDDCQQLHAAATRCVDFEDWNQDGMVDPSDRAVTDALCIDRECLADGTCTIEPFPVE